MLHWGGLVLSMVQHADHDPVIADGLTHRIKYVRLVRRISAAPRRLGSGWRREAPRPTQPPFTSNLQLNLGSVSDGSATSRGGILDGPRANTTRRNPDP